MDRHCIQIISKGEPNEVIEQIVAGRAYYPIHYFPFGTVGMSYDLADGFCQEEPLMGLR